MQHTTLLRLVTLAAALGLAACTRPKAVPAAAVAAVPAATAIPGEEPTPTPAPTASPTPAPTPSPSPTPRLVLQEPTATTDFSQPEVTLSFTAVAPEGRQVALARFYFDGRLLKEVEGPGPTFRLTGWNPNVENNVADPPETALVPSGDHQLAFEAVDDQGGVGRLEVGFYKQLRITRWMEVSGMPQAVSHHGVVGDGAEPPSFVSIWGSVDGVDFSLVPRRQVFAFNPAGAGTWATLTVGGSGVPRGGYALASHPSGQLVYLVGGRLGAVDTSAVDVYAPLRKVAETQAVALVTPRSAATAAVVEGHLYVFGGRSGGTPLYQPERTVLGPDGLPAGPFEVRLEALNARVGANAAVEGREVWLFGGGHRPVEVYDTEADTWRLLTDATGRTVATPESFAHAAMATVAGRRFFFGGLRDDGSPTDRIYEFNPLTQAWRDLGPLPVVQGEAAGLRALSHMAAFHHAGAFYLVGGRTHPEGRAVNRVFKGETL
ncbi:MAG: kelch repeat-containing protein [Candidatus Sericytochromatia bacterium]|nr:kelch repeat-containing protein [Candidatus Sericytochromatia bacterium]